MQAIIRETNPYEPSYQSDDYLIRPAISRGGVYLCGPCLQDRLCDLFIMRTGEHEYTWHGRYPRETIDEVAQKLLDQTDV